MYVYFLVTFFIVSILIAGMAFKQGTINFGQKRKAPEPDVEKGEKLERGFVHKWTVDFPWVRYDKEDGCMRCTRCEGAGIRCNFTGSGCTDWRRTSLTRHEISDNHKKALVVPEEQIEAAKHQDAITGEQNVRLVPHMVNAISCMENTELRRVLIASVPCSHA
jgi:hypothetical protein